MCIQRQHFDIVDYPPSQGPASQIADSWIQFNSGEMSPKPGGPVAVPMLRLQAVTMKLQAVQRAEHQSVKL